MQRGLRLGNVSLATALVALTAGSGLGVVAMQLALPSSPLVTVPASLGLVLCATVVGWSLARSRVVTPAAVLADAMEQLSEGELPPVLEFSDSRELGRVADAFNRMSASVLESTSRLERQAFQDTLTALPNRASFMFSFSKALMEAHRSGSRLAVLFLDVDRFKHLNDSLGHGVGDQLLSVLARRLQVAAKDHVVARLGGDEFTILIESERAESEALMVADRITQALHRPIALAGRELFVSMSVGIAVSSPEERTITELLRKADIALYRSKADGRARYTLFEPDQDAMSAEQFALDNALRRSVQQEELLLHFQPIVDLKTKRITGMEALLRWNHPHRGILAPATFISIAEETGDIIRIGHWVLEEACREAVELQRLRPEWPLNLSVNVSAAEFRQRDLPRRLARVLHETGMPAGQLELELTESVLVEHIADTLPVLQQIKAMGVRLAIDDFGTGYSSLSYLEQLPVDTLKIDRSFVARLGLEETTAPIVRAVVELGRSLDIGVIAEGVETEAQMEFLARMGCGSGQGFYFREGVPAREFGALLREEAAGSTVPRRRRGMRVAV